ncbi:heavy-metal-associated domain-containing protein [Roseococcus sp.]|uniref:heavy-metal-associated domain-containing protein n=1 Tax=Roseococcus sp. TaxID=2109646 RepID=UPI003BAC9381
MLKLKVPDMNCGHCAGVVTQVVQGIDSGAKLDIDVMSRTVSIVTSADPAEVTRALDAAGYATQPN